MSCSHCINQLSAKKIIERLCPEPPTHADIITFVEKFWPDIFLVEPATVTGEWDGVGGSTKCGTGAVSRAEIQIIMPLVTRWIESTSDRGLGLSISPSLAATSLCWFINSIIIHEATHRLVVWWGKGECDTPEIDGIGKESGRYIEHSWYGGLTVAEFPENQKGVFTEIRSVGLEVGDSYYPIVSGKSAGHGHKPRTATFPPKLCSPSFCPRRYPCQVRRCAQLHCRTHSSCYGAKREDCDLATFTE